MQLEWQKKPTGKYIRQEIYYSGRVTTRQRRDGVFLLMFSVPVRCQSFPEEGNRSATERKKTRATDLDVWEIKLKCFYVYICWVYIRRIRVCRRLLIFFLGKRRARKSCQYGLNVDRYFATRSRAMKGNYVCVSDDLLQNFLLSAFFS